jgi:poly(A) polymerase
VVGRYGTCQLTTPDGIQIEGVRARAESYLPDSRKPNVRNGSLQEDIDRRDFTINCLIIPVNEPEVVLDPTGKGRGDLEDKIIRTPISPAQTFSADPLRMLRAVRFASQLDFQIALETAEGIKKSSARLGILSRERIANELNGILLSPNPARGMSYPYDLGLIQEFAPDLATIRKATPRR